MSETDSFYKVDPFDTRIPNTSMIKNSGVLRREGGVAVQRSSLPSHAGPIDEFAYANTPNQESRMSTGSMLGKKKTTVNVKKTVTELPADFDPNSTLHQHNMTHQIINQVTNDYISGPDMTNGGNREPGQSWATETVIHNNYTEDNTGNRQTIKSQNPFDGLQNTVSLSNNYITEYDNGRYAPLDTPDLDSKPPNKRGSYLKFIQKFADDRTGDYTDPIRHDSHTNHASHTSTTRQTTTKTATSTGMPASDTQHSYTATRQYAHGRNPYHGDADDSGGVTRNVAGVSERSHVGAGVPGDGGFGGQFTRNTQATTVNGYDGAVGYGNGYDDGNQEMTEIELTGQNVDRIQRIKVENTDFNDHQNEEHVRSQLKSQIETQLRPQIENDLKQKITEELRSKIETNLRQDLERSMRLDLEKSMRADLHQSMRDELTEELTSKIHHELTSKLETEFENKLNRSIAETRRETEREVAQKVTQHVSQEVSTTIKNQLEAEHRLKLAQVQNDLRESSVKLREQSLSQFTQEIGTVTKTLNGQISSLQDRLEASNNKAQHLESQLLQVSEARVEFSDLEI